MLKRDEVANPESCLNKAHDHERIFVLLARDVAAPAAIRAWVDERIKRGKNAFMDSQIQDALECADRMEREQASMACKQCRGTGVLREATSGGVAFAALFCDCPAGEARR